MSAERHAEFYKELQAEIADLEQKLKELRLLAEYHGKKAGIRGNSSPRKRTKKKAAARRPHRSTGGITQAKAAESILREAGKPLRAAEIAQRVINSGFEGSDLKKLKISLFTTMTRQKHVFEKAGPGLWTLASPPSDD